MASIIIPNPLSPEQCLPYIKNRHIVELYKCSVKFKDQGQYSLLHRWICELAHIETAKVNANSLFSKVKSVYGKVCCLRKSKRNTSERDRLQEFKEEAFIFPVSEKTFAVNEKKRKIQHLEPESGYSTKRTKLEQKIKNLQRCKKVITQKLKRRNWCVSNLKKKYSVQKVILKRSVEVQVPEENSLFNKGIQCTIDRDTNELEQLRREVHRLENENLILREVKDHHVIRTSDKGRPFSPQVREVCYEFLSKGVAAANVPSLIAKTVNTLTDHKVSLEELPSVTSIKHMTYEMLNVGRQHIVQEVSASEDISIMRDGTTKKGKHLYGVKLSTEDNVFTLGVRQVCQATAGNLFKTTTDIIHDVAMASGDKKMDKKILTSVSSCMTDRCATELKVNKFMSEAKKDILPDVVENFTNLSNEEKKKHEHIYEFQCAVHPLLQFSCETEKVLKKVEKDKGISLKIFGMKGESYCQTFIRSISKLFYKDGIGDPLLIKSYMEQRVEKIPIISFKGNRFNALFYNAAGVFLLQKHLLSYLENTKQSLNIVEDAVLQGLRMPLLMSICQGLGIVWCSITQPYFQKASQSGTSALQMEPVYSKLIECLERWEQNVDHLRDGNECILDGVIPKNGENGILFTDNGNKEFLSSFLQNICSVICEKSRKLFKNFQEGEMFHEASEETIRKCQSCPANNISLERLMAQTDRSITIAPNANISTRESKIMYKENKTGQWLQGKEDTEKKVVIQNAIKNSRDLQEEDKLKKCNLRKEYVEILKKKEEDKKKKDQKKRKDIDKLLKSISESGYWMSEDEVDRKLRQCKNKTEQLTILKQQINARKKILGQKVSDKGLFSFSAKGKKFTVDNLRMNLLELINIHINEEINNDYEHVNVEDIRKQPECICLKYIHHTWSEGHIEKVWPGKILSFLKSKEMYKVSYWEEEGKEEGDTSVCYLTTEEVITDTLEGTLRFL